VIGHPLLEPDAALLAATIGVVQRRIGFAPAHVRRQVTGGFVHDNSSALVILISPD
jgi:hypothetical protein